MSFAHIDFVFRGKGWERRKGEKEKEALSWKTADTTLFLSAIRKMDLITYCISTLEKKDEDIGR